MYEPQHQQQQQNLLDLQDNTGFGSDPKSWLSGDDLSQSLSTLSAAAANAAATGTVDRVLFNDLAEMLPLLQSLIVIDRKSNSSFTRRGSMIYTKTPSRESLYKKTAGRSATLPTKKQRDLGDKDQNKNGDGSADDISLFSSRSLLSEKDREELMSLRDQVEDLKRQISEKDELLKSSELLKDEIASMHMKFDELKSVAAEKDSLFRSTQQQLSDLKIKLADKQAAVEKLQWEATNSNKKVEKLQKDLDTMEVELSSFMTLIEGLTRNEFAGPGEDYDVALHPLDQSHELDYLNEMEMQKLEAAREAYSAAVMVAKEKQDEGSIAAATLARSNLQSILLRQL